MSKFYGLSFQGLCRRGDERSDRRSSPKAEIIATQRLPHGRLELKRLSRYGSMRLAVMHVVGNSTAKHWPSSNTLEERIGELVLKFPGVGADDINDVGFRTQLASGAHHMHTHNSQSFAS